MALCFIGHGVWGVITKAAWLPFFVPFGISEDWAWKLMPVIGTFDITMGLLILHRPRRLILAWMVGWATLTAALRPIAGVHELPPMLPPRRPCDADEASVARGKMRTVAQRMRAAEPPIQRSARPPYMGDSRLAAQKSIGKM